MIDPERVDGRYERDRPLHNYDLSKADTQILRIAEEEVKEREVHVLTDDNSLKDAIYDLVLGTIVESNLNH